MKDPNEITIGMKVKVVQDNGTNGMLIKQKHLDLRRIGATGTIKGWVPGHGGDVWWVAQDDGTAAYSYTELESA